MSKRVRVRSTGSNAPRDFCVVKVKPSVAPEALPQASFSLITMEKALIQN
jgi:hypothetical protein